MRYDLSKIMKVANNLKKSGKYTMSEALKKSWKMEKFNVWMKEQSAILREENRIKAEKEAQRIAKAKAESAKAEAERAAWRAEQEAQRAAWRAEQEAQRAAERAKEERAAKAMGMTYNQYQEFLSRSMGYGVGRYCGD